MARAGMGSRTGGNLQPPRFRRVRSTCILDISLRVSNLPLHRIALHRIALYCIALHCIALHCIAAAAPSVTRFGLPPPPPPPPPGPPQLPTPPPTPTPSQPENPSVQRLPCLLFSCNSLCPNSKRCFPESPRYLGLKLEPLLRFALLCSAFKLPSSLVQVNQPHTKSLRVATAT